MIAKLSQHEADGCEFQKGEGVVVAGLPVLGKASAAVEPCYGAFDNPALGQDHEAFDPIRSSDDFGFEIGQDFGQPVGKHWPLIGAVGEQFPETAKAVGQARQQRKSTIAVLHASRVDNGGQHQTQRVDDNMPLLSLDQLACVKTMRINADPPFSALFTLWLSMMAALGLGSRAACLRHST